MIRIEIPNEEIYNVIGDYARSKVRGAENHDAHVRVRHASTIVTFTPTEKPNAPDNGPGREPVTGDPGDADANPAA